MVTSAVTQDACNILHKQGLDIRLVEYLIPTQDGPDLSDPSVSRFADTWTKLR
jgi:hypothetical protein